MTNYSVDPEGNFSYTTQQYNTHSTLTTLDKPDNDGVVYIDTEELDRPIWIPFDVLMAYVLYHKNKYYDQLHEAKLP